AGYLVVRIDVRPYYAACKVRQDAFTSKRQLFWAGQYAPRCRLLIRTDRCSAFLQNSRDVCVSNAQTAAATEVQPATGPELTLWRRRRLRRRSRLLVCRWLRGRRGRRNRRRRLLCWLLLRSGALRRLRWRRGSRQSRSCGQRPYLHFAARLGAGLYLDALRIDALGLGQIGHRIL